MTLTFKDKLEGQRITLKRTKPTLQMAQPMFDVINKNRKHLEPWFDWVNVTLQVEDILKYLFDREEETNKGQEVEYGIYTDKEYIGSISIFDINEKNQSAGVGYWLSATHTQIGYMTEAIKAIEKEAFENLKLNRIRITCDERNEASAATAQKSGYKYEGTFREDIFSQYHQDLRNTLVFAKLKSEFEKE